MEWMTAVEGRVPNMDHKIEFFAQKYPDSIPLVFSAILAVSFTPSTLLDGYKWGR